MVKEKMLEVYWDEDKDVVTIQETAAFKKVDSTAKMDIREEIIKWTKNSVTKFIKELKGGK